MSWAWLWITWTFFSAINVYKQNRETIRIGLENKKCVAEVINEIYAIRGNNLSIIMGFISNPRRAINRERGASDWLYGCFGSTLPVPAHRNGRPKCMCQLLLWVLWSSGRPVEVYRLCQHFEKLYDTPVLRSTPHVCERLPHVCERLAL